MTTRRTSNRGSRLLQSGSTGEPIDRNRRVGRTYRRPTGSSGRSRSPPWKTRSSRAQPSWRSMLSTKATSAASRTGSDPGEGHTMRWTVIKIRKGNWILDADIQNFFGAVSQSWLVRFLEHRVGDKRIIRLIQKWLKAGILEDGIVTVDDRGTGQGSVISPLL